MNYAVKPRRHRKGLKPQHGPPAPRPLWFVPAILLAAFLLVLGSILWVTQQNSYREKRSDLAVKADSLRKSLQLTMEGNSAYLLMLALERSSGKLSPELFQERAAQYVKSHPELINITWVDADFFIRDVAPLADNRQIVGLQLNLPEPKRVSRLARELRQPVYTRPFEAIQGKPSFEIWVPVFQGDSGTFLGLFGGVYSCDQLIKGLASQVQPQLYHASLTDASGSVLGELPHTGVPDGAFVHSALITSQESGIFLRANVYQSEQDWRLTVLRLLLLALVAGMAFTLWRLKLEIEERKRAQEAIKAQAALLELEVEERQMAQENLEEQATLLEEEIAERRQAEEALTSSEEKLRLILDSTGEAIYGIDLGGRCSFCNTACLKMLGYSHPDELLGKEMHLQIHHARSDGSRSPGQKCLHQALNQGERTHVDEELLWRADGSCFAAECRSYPQYKGGELIGAVVTFINITERKQLEEQFRQAQKMESIGRLAGGVAHDFNNMLSVILGAAELSRCKVAEGDPVLQYLELISKAARRSSEITRQLLAFSRKEVILPKPVNLNPHIVESEKMLARLINEDIKLSFRPSSDLWTVMIDPSQVDQVLMNLSVNARDAMPDGGSLTIETANAQISDDYSHLHPNARPGDYVLLTISDTGVGMDRATREHIFEPFFTTKGVGQGTGLGLATVYGIVTQNSGFINVYSEPGHGSVFRIYLPRLMQDAMPEDRATPQAPTVSETILLVEDEEMLLWMATRLLEQMGYGVIQAHSPEAAISLCEGNDQSIDLILTDVVMPGMNGSEMVNRIRAIRPELKVLFMSGYTAEIVAQRGIVDEGMHYIQKPLDMNRLNEKIREVLAQG
ncbi:MAG: histidine kinase [Geobacteraceae bacterium GWC2_58_44]|nr:MAG: histidine kinase [Geobacteraceae bacterium GWC2_58_44]HBG06791.1 histidine kinase [Geobacter sp.]